MGKSPAFTRESVTPDFGKRLSVWDRSRIATHRALLTAGIRLFIAKGFSKTTAAKIARTADVAVGTFYLHFRDKEALLHEAWKETFERIARKMLWIAHPSEELRASTLAERIRTNADTLMEWVLDNPEEFRFWHGPEVASTSVGAEISGAWIDGIEDRLRVEVSSESVHAEIDVAVAAQALAGMYRKVLLWWSEDPTRVSREAVLTTLTRLHLSIYSA